MEPILFPTKSQFPSGTTQEIASHEVIFDEDKAKPLLFSQFPPTEYMIWGDFFRRNIRNPIKQKVSRITRIYKEPHTKG